MNNDSCFRGCDLQIFRKCFSGGHKILPVLMPTLIYNIERQCNTLYTKFWTQVCCRLVCLPHSLVRDKLLVARSFEKALRLLLNLNRSSSTCVVAHRSTKATNSTTGPNPALSRYAAAQTRKSYRSAVQPSLPPVDPVCRQHFEPKLGSC